MLISLLAVILILTLVFSALPHSLPQQMTPNNIQRDSNFSVSNNTGNSVYPSIAASGNNVYVVWQDDYLGHSVSYDKENNDIFFSRSTNGGNSFENISNLSDNIVLSERPIIAAFEYSVYVVWIEDTGEDKQIWFRKSTDSGSTFDKPIKLSTEHRIKDYILPKAIAAFGNNVYVAWRQLNDVGKGGHIFFKASTDNGDSFSETREISNNAVYSSSPKIAAFNNSVYVVWDIILNEGEKNRGLEGIYLAKSSDNGVSFENETKLNGNKEFGEAQVAAYANEVYVAWTGSVYKPRHSIRDVFFTFSFDNGGTFGNTILMNKDFLGSENVELAANEGRIDAVWQDKISGNGEIFYKQSSNNKTNFIEPARNLSSTAGLSECPSIALAGNRTYVVWEDDTYGNHEIFFKKVVSV